MQGPDFHAGLAAAPDSSAGYHSKVTIVLPRQLGHPVFIDDMMRLRQVAVRIGPQARGAFVKLIFPYFSLPTGTVI